MSRTLITSSITEGQKKQIRRVIDDGVDEGMNIALRKIEAGKEGADRILAAGNELKKAVMHTVIDRMIELSFTYGKQLVQWQVFYRKHFNLMLDVSELSVPTHQKGFDRLIVVAQGLTCNQVYEACAKQFPCWCYADDLDEAVPTNDRDPKHGTYAIWVRDRVEADEENKNQSAQERKGQSDETLLERMLHELKFFDETGKHLDIKNWTLCAGSRDSDGFVPNAFWYDGEFGVDWYDSDDSDGRLRARSVVSLAAKPSESVAQQT